MGQNESMLGLNKKSNYIISEIDTNIPLGVLAKGRYQNERLWDMVGDHFCMKVIKLNFNADTIEYAATLRDDAGDEYTYNISVLEISIY